MSATIYLLTLGLPLATCLLIFGMRYLSAVLQARARLANDDAYRQLAEKSAAALASIDANLADVRQRLAAVEKVLKEVE
jgi:hypothetical protein